MWGNRIIYLLLVFAALVFHAMNAAYLSFCLLALVIALPVVSLILCVILRKKLSITIDAPVSAVRGEAVSAYINISHASKLAVPQLRGALTVSGDGERIQKIKLRLRGVTQYVVDLPIRTNHCQVVELSLPPVRMCDHLSLFSFAASSEQSAKIAVMPLAREMNPRPEIPEQIGGVNMKAKPGGGYAEEHDLREYREGDTARMVHWKLSSKMDELIVREPLVPEEISLVVTFDLPENAGRRDGVLDNVVWLSHELIERELPHSFRWLDSSGEVHSDSIACEEDAVKSVRNIIISAARTPEDKTAHDLGKNASWHCHISAGETEAGV